MRLFVIGDVHLRESRDNADWSFNHNGFMEFLKSLKLTENDTVIQLGDLFEKTTHRGATNKAGLQAIKYLSDNCKQVFLLQGNHEISKYSGSNLDSIDIFENVVVEKDIAAHVKPEDTSKAVFLFLPYIEGLSLNGKYEEEVNKYCEDNKIVETDYIFGHHMFKENTIMNNPYLDLDLLKVKYKRVIQGHVHKFETFKRGNRNDDICIGSVCPNKKDEAKNQFTYLRIDDNGVEYNIIPPKFFSQFVTYNYGDEQVPGMRNMFVLAKAKVKKEGKFEAEQELRKMFPNNLYEIEWDIIEEEQTEKIEVVSDDELVKKFFEVEKYSKEVRDLFGDYNNRAEEVV